MRILDSMCILKKECHGEGTFNHEYEMDDGQAALVCDEEDVFRAGDIVVVMLRTLSWTSKKLQKYFQR